MDKSGEYRGDSIKYAVRPGTLRRPGEFYLVKVIAELSLFSGHDTGLSLSTWGREGGRGGGKKSARSAMNARARARRKRDSRWICDGPRGPVVRISARPIIN